MLKELAAPFDPKRISWRVGSTTKDKSKGMALAYIDSRDVQDRLDAVCGAGGWQCRYPHAGQKTVCEIGVKIDGEWVWKADGAGDSDVEAEKGALSDAFKRAAVKWGVGRYLYDLDSPWVELEAKGNSYIIAPREMARLHKILGSTAPAAQTQQAQTPDGLPRMRNAPGVAEARKWTRDYINELKAVENKEQFVQLLYGAKTRFIRMIQAYPGVYEGPDGSGLRGETMKISNIVDARSDFDTFIKEVELMARETQAQAAE
jgi:hypothetical protein